jgi:micrococcal nuclease
MVAGAGVVLAACWAGLAGCGAGGDESTPSGPAVRARVLRVIDGDTIEVAIGGREEDVRYIGVDTPETVKPGTPVQCYGPQAKAENRRLVAGKAVRLIFDRERRDAYGRLLAYVHAGSRFVNAALVRGGYARSLTIRPNTAHASLLRRLEVGAGQDGRGLWGSC